MDTDWVVDWLKGRKSTVERLSALAPEGLAMSLITYGEIYEGIYSPRATDPTGYERTFNRFLRLVRVLPLTRAIMRRFARERAHLRHLGALIPDADLLIASTALDQGLTLLTGNRQHFERVPGLTLANFPR